ncbi:MAG: holo-ACP synthase [Alphaproteobacteria bacterium]|nr:holo-ACP synthase [Alphaproteobacteria bacterium]
MMILGLGNDIVNIERIQNTREYLQHFAARILGPDEQAEISRNKAAEDIRFRELLAKYYAAKEAFVKALGTGFRDGIFFKDIQILHNELGKPELKISGMAQKYLLKLNPNPRLFVTLSDDMPFAFAVVIIEA